MFGFLNKAVSAAPPAEVLPTWRVTILMKTGEVVGVYGPICREDMEARPPYQEFNISAVDVEAAATEGRAAWERCKHCFVPAIAGEGYAVKP